MHIQPGNRAMALEPEAMTGGTFASQSHLARLRQLVIDSCHLTDENRWHWQSYMYGFRRVFMRDRAEKWAGDPDGKWFNDDLVTRAEALFLFRMGIHPAARRY